MPSLNEIRTLTIRSQVDGADQATRALQGIATGQAQVATSAQAATEKSTAYEAALTRQQRAMDLADAQAQRFAIAMSGVGAAQQLIERATDAQARRINAAAAANDNYADSSNHVASALRVATTATIEHSGAYLATLGAVGAVVVVFGSVLAIVGQIILGYHAVKLAIDLVTEAWDLGGQKLESYRKIAEDAAKVDLAADYFQRITKAATDAKLPVDELTAALQNLAKVSQDKLGGSDLANKLDKLSDAGNFSGNAGVDQFFSANTTQQKFEAIAKTIHDAMADGERLAALDLANTAFGPEVTARLRDDSEYLDKLLASAQGVKNTEIISDAEVNRAVALKAQYDAAVTILEQRWHPIQQVLTDLGVQMQIAWINIVSAIAAAVDGVISLAQKLSPILPALQAVAGASLRLAGGAIPGVGSAIAASDAVSALSSGTPDPGSQAAGYDKLRVAMQNYNNVQRAVAETNAVQFGVWKDTSKAQEDTANATNHVTDAVDRAINTLTRHVEQQKADALAVGLGDAALARFRAEAAETAAVQANGGQETAAQAAQFAQLKDAAAAAADALAKAKVASQIEFAQKTAFLSPADVQIAQQLKGIYGNDIPAALASTEAAQLRVINAQKEMKDNATQFAQTFVQGLLSGKSAMDSLVAAADQLASKLADKAITDLFSGNFIQAGVEATIAVGATLFSNESKNAKALKEAQDQWAKAGPAFQKFLSDMSSTPQGSIADTLQQAYQQGSDLYDKAHDAKDYKAEQQIIDAYNEYSATLKARFAALFQVTITGLEDGLGPNSPLLQAANNVAQALASAQDFLGNTNTVFGKGGQYAQAQEAEQDYLLSLLQTQPALSAVQQGMLQIRGTASALQGALEQLGLSSGDAAAAINAGVTKAIDALAVTFGQGLTERLNAANGQDYLNSAQSLLSQHAQDLADAAALGGNPALLAQVQATFQAEAQKLVNDAGLVGDQFADFIKLFPQFSGVVTQATDKLTQSIQTIQDYLSSLQLGSNSTLSPQDKLALAESSFQKRYQLAAGGDAGALSGITQAASTLLDLAKSFYASSAGFTAIQGTVISALQGLAGGASSGALDNSMFTGASALSSSLSGAIAPQLTVSGANDNGQVAQQTASLSQVFTQVGQAQIMALQAGVADLGARLDRIANAVEKRGDKPDRPANRSKAA